MSDPVYHGKAHILSTDNWYTSLPVAEHCRSIGVHLNGTIKTNKKGLPKEGIFPKTGRGKKERGTIKVMKAERGQNTFYFTAWMDTKPVHMLSTYESFASTVRRTRLGGAYQRIEIRRPTVIADYNKGMGGTDRGDQQAVYYRFNHRTVKWQHRIISHFLMSAAVNAFILSCAKPTTKSSAFLPFLHQLLGELAESNAAYNESDEDEPAVNDVPAGQPHMSANFVQRSGGWQHDFRRLTASHTPLFFPGEQGRCKANCGNRTQMKCAECDAWLCKSTSLEGKCWQRFHSCEIMLKSSDI